MNVRIWGFAATALTGVMLGFHAGCGRGGEDPARVNAVVAGLAPPPATPTDMGILADQSGYQPTEFERLEGVGPAGTETAPPDSPEAAEIRGAIDAALAGLVDGNLDAVLRTLPADAETALRGSDFVDSAGALFTAVKDVVEAGAARDPAGAQDAQAMAELVPLGRQLIVSALTVDVDSGTARIGMSLERLKSGVEQRRDALLPALDSVAKGMAQSGGMGGMGMGGEAPADGAALYEELLRGIDEAIAADQMGAGAIVMHQDAGAWRFELPVQIGPDQADALSEAATTVAGLAKEVAALVRNSDAATPEALQAELQGWQSQNMFRFLAAVAPLANAFAAAEPQVAVAEAVDQQPEPEPEPEPEPQRRGGRFASRFAGGVDLEDEEDEPAPAGGGGSSSVSFINDIEPLISARCSECHKPLSPVWQQVKLDLRGRVYDELTSKSSGQDDSLRYIVAGNPDASYLIEKITADSPTFGNRMPPKGAPLSQSDIDLIRQWIADGAPNN